MYASSSLVYQSCTFKTWNTLRSCSLNKGIVIENIGFRM